MSSPLQYNVTVEAIGPARTTTWTLSPANPPRVLRRCARCSVVRPFSSSGRFRINAQRRRLDAWLIYRCERCEATWNRTVFTRRTPAQIGLPLLRAMERNDPDEAARVAHDVSDLRRNGLVFEDEGCVVVTWSDPRVLEQVRAERHGTLVVRLRLATAVAVRLDQLLAEQLGLPRSRLRRWEARGSLRITPTRKNALRRKVRDGTTVWIDAAEIL